MDRLRDLLAGAKEVLYLFDNCGEIVLDVPLIRELRSMGLKVTGVVKGEPIITDATWEDLAVSGADQALSGCLTTGAFAIGVDMELAPQELKDAFSRADLVLAKGMANFEALSDLGIRPIAHLLRSKCHPVSQAIGARKDRNVIKVFE